jgi:hypothetical protein
MTMPGRCTVHAMKPLMVALALVVLGCSLLLWPQPSTVDDLRVLPVREVLADRAAGGLKSQSVAVRGYWSSTPVLVSCAAPQAEPGALELYCLDGVFGITDERRSIDYEGTYLTPFVDSAFSAALFKGSRRVSPEPITAIGHFDDPRAAQCRAIARKLCLDRFVMDRIVSLG